MLATIILFVASMSTTFASIADYNIDNRIIEAQLICSDLDMQLHVLLERPLFQESRIFVKGLSRDHNCIHIYHTSRVDNALMFRVPLSTCGMVRTQRQKGAFTYTIAVVVSFHKVFITQVDRAYHLTCEYQRPLVTTTAATIRSYTADVSSTAIADRNDDDDDQDVECSYKLYVSRDGAYDNDEQLVDARQADIGDTIVHQWQCANLDVDDEYMWVHDCVVNPEFTSVDDPIAIDSRGCSVDEVIMSELEYRDHSLVIGRHRAYKFADYPNLLFKCAISICRRSLPSSCSYTDGSAIIVPPICARYSKSSPAPRSGRSAESTNDTVSTRVFELLSTPIAIGKLIGDNQLSNIEKGTTYRVCFSRIILLIVLVVSAICFAAITCIALMLWRSTIRQSR